MSDDTATAPGVGFFAIDKNAWPAVCKLGVNCALAYLVMCRGTGHDNRTTSWSVNAIEKKAQIGRGRAKDAVQTLILSGLVTYKQEGAKPRYFIEPAALEADYRPDWVWLPNSIVDGVPDGITPIVLLRQMQSIAALVAFVLFYHMQSIDEEGGMDWRRQTGVRKPYDREQIGSWGEYSIWVFTPIKKYDVGSGFPVFREMTALGFTIEDMHAAVLKLLGTRLLRVVAHLVESDTQDGEIMHACPYDTDGEELELAVARAAHGAAEFMAQPFQIDREGAGYYPLAPVKAHITEVEMVGVLRMRYLPVTAKTKAWEKSNEGLRTLRAHYEKLKERASGDYATLRGYKG